MINAFLVNNWFVRQRKELNSFYELIEKHIKNRDVITDSLTTSNKELLISIANRTGFLEVVEVGLQNTMFVKLRFKIKLDYSELNDSHIKEIFQK